MDYVSSGCRLFYQELGAGPDIVVLLHPTPVDHHFWLPVAAQLKDRYRVLLPDLRGHGASAMDASGISIRQLGADILRLLDHLDLRRAIFAGCSIGSYTLYEIWRQAPERAAGLFFCCGKPQADTPETRATRERWIEDVTAKGTEGFFRLMLESLVGKPAARSEPERMAALLPMMQRMSPDAVIAVQRTLRDRPDSLATARTVTVPANVVAGALDPSSTPAEMRQLADALPHAPFHLLEETGHYAPYERPDAVGALLRRFCDDVSAGRGAHAASGASAFTPSAPESGVAR